jgi:hypothetical protein
MKIVLVKFHIGRDESTLSVLTTARSFSRCGSRSLCILRKHQEYVARFARKVRYFVNQKMRFTLFICIRSLLASVRRKTTQQDVRYMRSGALSPPSTRESFIDALNPGLGVRNQISDSKPRLCSWHKQGD